MSLFPGINPAQAGFENASDRLSPVTLVPIMGVFPAVYSAASRFGSTQSGRTKWQV
ncbi:hypothetical protein HPDFL43_00025430 [Hoeflea phototrophica DFL-43]|uniref:Uncharacterized protein n=1 Tax=Hoeflea phototrophica (strain DSM 17068 / NCIMB 14078 / DFL-43) TaxID=411684 RepID=A0A094Z2E3_HOEPD|nr:hypothetical protein HPDFL43_00025430 [Hoeflea phototrophica DFL-43]